MAGAGIALRDVVDVEHNAATKPGDIVLASNNGHIIVRSLQIDDMNELFLEASDPSEPQIEMGPTTEILGVVVSVARRIRHVPAASIVWKSRVPKSPSGPTPRC